MHDDDDDRDFRHKKIVQEHERNYKPIVHLITQHMMGEIVLGEKGIDRPIPYPADADDFGRVKQFLDKHPDWRQRLSEMSLYSQRWMILSENWERLEKLYQSQDAETFKDTLQRVMGDAIDGADALSPPSQAFRAKVQALVEGDIGYQEVRGLTLGQAVRWGNELARLLEQENCRTFKVWVGNKDKIERVGAKGWQNGLEVHRVMAEDFDKTLKGPYFARVAYSRHDDDLPEQPELGDEGMAI